jgi:hypothetical protein
MLIICSLLAVAMILAEWSTSQGTIRKNLNADGLNIGVRLLNIDKNMRKIRLTLYIACLTGILLSMGSCVSPSLTTSIASSAPASPTLPGYECDTPYNPVQISISQAPKLWYMIIP